MTQADSVSPTPLCEEAVTAITRAEVERARQQYPRWAHPFRKLAFSHARRVLGQAHSDGTMKLSRVFIGTTAHEDLVDTIRHEIAHLVVGLRAGHGAAWRRAAAALGAIPRAGARAGDPELLARMDDAPWDLVAELADGSEVVLRASYRRARQYRDYRGDRAARGYYYRGQLVRAFRYDPRSR